MAFCCSSHRDHFLKQRDNIGSFLSFWKRAVPKPLSLRSKNSVTCSNNLCQDPAVCYGNSKYNSKSIIIPPCLCMHSASKWGRLGVRAMEPAKSVTNIQYLKPTLKLPTLKWDFDLVSGQARTHWSFSGLLKVPKISSLCSCPGSWGASDPRPPQRSPGAPVSDGGREWVAERTRISYPRWREFLDTCPH